MTSSESHHPFLEQIFQVAPTFIMVDIQKAAGDAEEYLKVFVYQYSRLTFCLLLNIDLFVAVLQQLL